MYHPKILVLLSSWNGQQFILEQLSSIISQDIDAKLHILIRDDGSTDETVQIIRSLNNPCIELIVGENIGAKASFFSLIAEARNRDADFVALADQDDVWKTEKLKVAIEKLQLQNGPALYCSAMNLVDADLNPLGLYRFNDELGFEGSFFSNGATGCSCVFNRDLLVLLEKMPAADEVLMHDWWLYLIASAFGKVVYDRSSHILYRQHVSNQVGMRTGYAALLHRFRMFFRRPARPSRLTQAIEFRRIYGDYLIPSSRHYLSELITCKDSFLKRIRFAFTFRPHRKGLLDEIFALAVFILDARSWR